MKFTRDINDCDYDLTLSAFSSIKLFVECDKELLELFTTFIDNNIMWISKTKSFKCVSDTIPSFSVCSITIPLSQFQKDKTKFELLKCILIKQGNTEVYLE